MFFIDGKKMPSPSGLSVSYADRGDFSRFNVLGERVADRTATKRTIEANWAMLSDAEMKALIEAVSGGIFFVVKYPDPVTGAQYECTCRAAERSARMFRKDANGAKWADVALRLEEK